MARQLDDTVAALRQAEQQQVSDRTEAAARLAAMQNDAESQLALQLAKSAADAAAALKEAEERAAMDRQTAADLAVQRQAEFDKQLAAEVAERQLRSKQLAQAMTAHQQSERQHASELAAAAAQLADTKKQAEAQLALAAADAALARKEAEARAAVERRRFDHGPASMCRCTLDGRVLLVNDAFARLLGYETAEDLRQIDLASEVFESADELRWIVERCRTSSSPESIETTWIRKDGGRFIVRVRAAATPDSIEMTSEDITTLRVLEEKLRVSQRMEAVARYASEVAVICDNLLRHVEAEGRRWLAGSASDEARYHGQLLLEDVTQAAKYLNQLTVYGNEEKGARELVDLNTVLRDLEPVLKHVAGSDIDLVLPTGAPSLNLDVEAERVERMLVNVAAHGRARMPAGGRLMFQVAPTQLDRTFAEKYPSVRPGAHVLLTVNETRAPMRPDLATVRSHTSGKEAVANSPGVDLTTLQSLVSGCGGHLWMTAEPQGDMVLKIHLPRRALDGAEPRARVKPPTRPPARGGWLKRAAGLQN
jgi:PAS domain S-box-containing protein